MSGGIDLAAEFAEVRAQVRAKQEAWVARQQRPAAPKLQPSDGPSATHAAGECAAVSPATSTAARTALLQDFGLSVDDANMLLTEVESISEAHTPSWRQRHPTAGASSGFMEPLSEDLPHHHFCFNHNDPRGTKRKMSLDPVEQLVEREADPQTSSATGSECARGDEPRLVSYELRKPANIAILERICSTDTASRQIARAFFTAFGDDHGKHLTLLQFKRFIRDTGICDHGVSLSAISIMFTTLTKPLAAMGAGSFALAIFYLASMVKQTTSEDDFAALGNFLSTTVQDYITRHLPWWADPETNVQSSNEVVRALLLAYETPLEELYALSETDPLKQGASSPQSGVNEGPTAQLTTASPGVHALMRPTAATATTSGGRLPHNKHGASPRPPTAPVSRPLRALQGNRAAESRSGGGVLPTASAAVSAMTKHRRGPSDSQRTRLQLLFPSFVAPEHCDYYTRGCHLRTFMRLHMLVRFVNSLGLPHVTTSDVIRAARAAAFAFPLHPFRQQHHTAVTDVDTLFVLAPEFADTLIRLSVVAYPVASTVRSDATPTTSPHVASLTVSLLAPAAPRGPRNALHTRRATASRRGDAAPLIMKHPGESFDALIRFHIREMYFATFRAPISSKLNPAIDLERLGSATVDPSDAMLSRQEPPLISSLQLQPVAEDSHFSINAAKVVRNDYDAGRVCVVRQEGGLLLLGGPTLHHTPAAFILFNDRISVRCHSIDHERKMAQCTAPPLQLVSHRLTNTANSTDFGAFWQERVTEKAPDDAGGERGLKVNPPARVVGCVRDGTWTVRVVSKLRFPVSIRFSADGVHWSPRAGPLPSPDVGLLRFHEGLKKLAPLVVLYEQRLPVVAVPKELCELLEFIFESYCKCGDPLNDGVMTLEVWHLVCNDYFSTRAERGEHCEFPLRVTNANITRAFSAHSITMDAARSRASSCAASVNVLRPTQFFSALLELMVNEHVVEQGHSLSTGFIMAPRRWWDTLSECIRWRAESTRQECGLKEFVHESTSCPNVSTRTILPDVPRDTWGACFGPRRPCDVRTIAPLAPVFGIALMDLEHQSGPRIFDVFQGPVCVGTISDVPGPVVVGCGAGVDGVTAPSSAHLSFAQHQQLDDPALQRHLVYSPSFNAAVQRLLTSKYYLFATNIGETINGNPQPGHQNMRSFRRHTTEQKGQIATRPFSWKSAAVGSQRVDGCVGTRLWRLTKNFQDIGSLINIPGQASTTTWTPPPTTLTSPVAALTLHHPEEPLSRNFTHIAELFLAAGDLPALRDNLEKSGIQLTMVFPAT